MTTMRVIASFQDWSVSQDTNGVLALRHGGAVVPCDVTSAYEAIRFGVKDPAVRGELLKQWSRKMGGLF